MMLRKINIIFCWLCFFFTCFVVPAEEPQTVHLPVRVFDKFDRPVTRLKKEDFKLTVNDREGEILNVIEKENSIGRKPDLGRFFVLSFHIAEYTKQVEKGISFFVTEIVGPGDTLVILSPVRIYRFDASVNKEEMIRQISAKLKNDFHQFYKRYAAKEKKLSAMIRQLKRVLVDVMQFPGPYVGSSNFLNNFPMEYIDFTRQYLLPSIESFRQINNLLNEAAGEGERWWIHFRERDVTVLNYKVKEIFKEIGDFITDSPYQVDNPRIRALAHQYDQVKKQLFFGELFTAGPLLSTLLTGNVRYNCILLTGLKKIDAEVADTIGGDQAKILEKISIHSGGGVVKAEKFEQGVIDIKDHVDHYYDVAFTFDGKIEKKEIRLELHGAGKEKENTLVYKNIVEAREVEALSRGISSKSVEITGFSQEHHIIRFSIASFGINRVGEEKFGLLKVGIEVFDPQGVSVYRSEKTLRASKEELDIALPLPVSLGGEFKLSITVSDLIAGRTAALHRNITL